MRVLFYMLLTVVYIFADDDLLVKNINSTLQKVILETKKRAIKEIDITYDPFNQTTVTKKIVNKQKSKTQTRETGSSKPILSMIFNNRAFINGKWYKENSKIADYVITKINQDIVILKKNNKYTTLKLQTSDKVLITKEEI